MRIADLLERQRPVFSFEFFPPKTDEGQQTLRNTLEILKDDEPDYVSVTYGAGGTTRNRTVEITKTIKGDFGIEAMAHLSCVGEPRERLVQILEEIDAAGIQNVLALRGVFPVFRRTERRSRDPLARATTTGSGAADAGIRERRPAGTGT